VRATRVRRIVAILVVLGCVSYLVLNVVDGVRFWLAYRLCDSSCSFAVYVGPLWIVPILWVLSLLAAAAIGIRLTTRLMRRSPATADT
jgi:uncharacterized protein YneF (UPF0154 family)